MLEGTLKIIWSNPPASSRDIFHQPRVLTAPSNLALNTAREGAAHSFSGQPGPGPHHPHGEKFLPNL